MLRELHITDLGVIDDAHLEVAPGLNVLTGETGAGKTMVVDALTLLLGERAASASVRAGSPAAAVEARLDVDEQAAATLADAGLAPEDGEVLVARQVQAGGRSSARVQGRMATASLLAEVVGSLIEIHGQHEFQTLLRPSVQRDLLDRFAGPDAQALRAAWGRAWRRLTAVTAELDRLHLHAAQRERDAELLGYQLAEINAAGVRVGEADELAEEAERLTNAEALRDAAATAHALLAGADDDPDAAGAAPSTAQATRLVTGAGHHDPTLATLAERAAGLAADLTDLASDLRAYAETVQADPARLTEVTERIALLADLDRKYGPGEAAILAFAEQAASRLAELEGGTARTSELEAEAEALRAELASVGPKLTAARAQAAKHLAEAVRAELDALNMQGARLEVAVTPANPPGEDGPDRVELQLAANPGLPMRPLAKAASGGELSRVMLALRVVLARVDRPATIVFDEVDAGVGGRTAAAVGRRLAALAAVHQILVVTHLPQIAAFADRHFLVEKHTQQQSTRTVVRTLDEPGRRTELSRMLSGSPESSLAQAHAEELLAAANATKRAADRPQPVRNEPSGTPTRPPAGTQPAIWEGGPLAEPAGSDADNGRTEGQADGHLGGRPAGDGPAGARP